MSRFPSISPAALALAAGLAGAVSSASAQTRPWVDPPTRSRTVPPAREPAKPAEPAAPAASTAPAAPPAVVVAPDASTAPATAKADTPAAAPAREPASAPTVAQGGELKATSRSTAEARPHRPSRHAARVALNRRGQALEVRVRTTAPLTGSLTDYAAAARRLTLDYLAAMSGPPPVAASTVRLYGPGAVFHGRPVNVAALAAEKRRFVARWPERRYRPFTEALTVACNAAAGACVVRTPFDFVAESPARGAQSRGMGVLVLGVRFENGQPVIASEASRVVSRDRVARAMPEPFDEE